MIKKTEVIKVRLERVDENQENCYKILATYIEDEDKINRERCSAGRFIIATNILESKELSNDSMISEYKAQQSCVRGARTARLERIWFSQRPFVFCR